MKCTTSHPAAAGGLKGCSLSNHGTIWADIADLVCRYQLSGGQRDIRSAFGEHSKREADCT